MGLKKFKLKRKININLKRLVSLFLVIMMIISSIFNINVFANEREEYFPNKSYDYEYKGGRVYDYDGYGIKNNPGLMQTIVKLYKKNTSNFVYAYCIDPYISPKENALFSIVDIEDVVDYEDFLVVENAPEAITYIVANSLPFNGDSIGHFKSKFLPNSKYNFNLDENVSLFGEGEIKKQINTATQFAIWYFSKGLEYKHIHKQDTMSNDEYDRIDTNIETLFNIIVDKAKTSENDQVSVANIIHKDPIISVNKDNPNNIDVEFIFKIDGENIHHIDYTLEPASLIDKHDVSDDGFAHIKVEDIPIGTNIKVIASAIQNLGTNGGVYFFKPKDGRDASQSLVGMVSGDINIYDERNYNFSPIDINLQAIKKLAGKDLEEGMFNFKVYEGDDVVASGTNNQDGIIEFSPIIYNKEGSHTYTIKEEEEGNSGGILYDKTEYEVAVNVTRNDEGVLVATPIYPEGGVVFNNSYTVKPTTAKIEGYKELIGKDLEEGMFSFELVDENNKVIDIVENTAEGEIKFKPITYSRVGTYKYKVREVKGTLGGIHYDDSEYEVTVKVTDDKKGNLASRVVYPKDGLVFNNSYEIGTTSEIIKGSKELTGKDLEEGMFSFELVDENNKVIDTVENTAEGKIKFKRIKYSRTGVYKYKVREVKGILDGIYYDDSEYEVTVKVTDDGNGNLKAEVVYPEGGIVFQNTVIEGTLEFTKTDVSTGNVIDGAKIKITCTEGLDKGKVIEFTSSKEGNKFELKAGKYTFEETQAPEGYELTKEVGTFEIKENGEIVKVELKNYPIKGSVKLIKVDKDDNEKRIQGAKFVLLGSDKETIIAENLVTDSEGKIIVSNLEPGTYYFKETEAASGYILDETLIEVKVESNQQTISTVTFENEKEQEGGGLPDIDPEGDIPEEEGGSPDTDSNVSSPNTNNNTNSNVSSPNTNTNNNTNSNVNSSTNSSGSYPKTSDTSIAGYAISGIVSIGTLVGINRKRKDK